MPAHRRCHRTVAALALLLAAAATAGCRAEHTDRERLAAPADADTVPPMAAPADTALLTFTCDDTFRFTLRDEGDSATLFLPDSTVRLERSAAAVGRRYTRAGVELWHDVTEATLDLHGRQYLNCRVREGADPWTDARLRGVTFRAVGQEPGWVLDIAADSIAFTGDYGEWTMRMATPPPVPADGATTWAAQAGERHLRIVAEPTSCADIMSGEIFPWSVRVVLDDRAWTGCGRRLD
jgi:putative lipoprotein